MVLRQGAQRRNRHTRQPSRWHICADRRRRKPTPATTLTMNKVPYSSFVMASVFPHCAHCWTRARGLKPAHGGSGNAVNGNISTSVHIATKQGVKVGTARGEDTAMRAKRIRPPKKELRISGGHHVTHRTCPCHELHNVLRPILHSKRHSFYNVIPSEAKVEEVLSMHL